MLQGMEGTAADVREETEKRPGPANPFPKGNKIWQGGKEPEPEDESIPELLRDLRHVKSKPPSQDKTPARRQLRAMSKKDYGKFLAMWKEEEKLFREASKPAEQVAGPVDVGSGKCLELIDRLLSDFEGGAR